jgi:hypothetical protein
MKKILFLLGVIYLFFPNLFKRLLTDSRSAINSGKRYSSSLKSDLSMRYNKAKYNQKVRKINKKYNY